jgi:predicted metal-dependent hydrolase
MSRPRARSIVNGLIFAALLAQFVWLVGHVVGHLEVMDHSPRFWALLARWCPGYRAHSRWLRRHGQTLVL